jgi:DNA polymerase I
MLGNGKFESLWNKILVVDLPYLIHRSYKAGGTQATVYPHPDAASAVVPKTISTLKSILRPRDVYFAIEAGHDHRDSLHPGYKDRGTKEPELVSEILTVINELVEASELVVYAEGLEADDVMATMAYEHGKECILVTADKDMHQLVDVCHIFHPYDKVEVTRNDVIGRWGIQPHQLGDMLAMNGDTADSIPGLKGIGPKKAAVMLKEFGSLDNILRHADRMSEETGLKTWKTISESKDSVRTSRKLVQLVVDAEIKNATISVVQKLSDKCI